VIDAINQDIASRHTKTIVRCTEEKLCPRCLNEMLSCLSSLVLYGECALQVNLILLPAPNSIEIKPIRMITVTFLGRGHAVIWLYVVHGRLRALGMKGANRRFENENTGREYDHPTSTSGMSRTNVKWMIAG
jgi:hypothetical protein